MNWIFVLFFLELCLFFLAFLLSGKDIMAPSVMMSIMFSISTLFALFSLEKVKVTYSFEACFLLFSGILTFIIAESLFRVVFQSRPRYLYYMKRLKNHSVPDFQAIKVQNWMIIALILFDAIVFLQYYNRICYLTGKAGSEAIAAIRNFSVNAVVVKNEDRLFPLFLTQLLKVVTASGYICSFLLLQKLIAKEKNYFQQMGFLCIVVISQGMNLLSGGRTNLLSFASALLIEYYIIWHYKNGWSRNLSYKYVGVGMFCLIVGAPIFYYSRNLIGRPTTATLFEEIAVYLGYSIYLFDAYVKSPTVPVSFGEETLGGLFGFLSRVFGIDVYVAKPSLEFRYFSETGRSNIYTFFRRPLHDFGMVGMYIFTILVALLFAWIYYKKIKWRDFNRKTAGWILVYGYLYYWIIVSSMEEFSFSYISFSSVSTILAIVVGYYIMTNFSFRGRRIIIRRKLKSHRSCTLFKYH